MKSAPFFKATIWIGSKVHGSGEVIPYERAMEWLQQHVDEHPFCVSVTPTEFVYTKGREPGLAVGIINYPRFPVACSDLYVLRERTIEIAKGLKQVLQQWAVSIVFDDTEILMLEDGDEL